MIDGQWAAVGRGYLTCILGVAHAEIPSRHSGGGSCTCSATGMIMFRNPIRRPPRILRANALGRLGFKLPRYLS